MSKPRYKTQTYQRLYDAMLVAAQDKGSELYYNGKLQRMRPVTHIDCGKAVMVGDQVCDR